MAEKKKKGLIQEFKEFISRGSVIDLAVGVIIGTAFTAIVNSLVNDIVMQLIGLLTGGLDFSMFNIKLTGDSALMLGSFIGAVINFLLIALVIFLVVKGINSIHLKKPEPEEPEKAPRLCPYCRTEIADDATRCPHCTSILPDDACADEAAARAEAK